MKKQRLVWKLRPEKCVKNLKLNKIKLFLQVNDKTIVISLTEIIKLSSYILLSIDRYKDIFSLHFERLQAILLMKAT